MKRVVITGMGAVTPIGNTVADMWDSMMHGNHGIAPIIYFDTEGFATKIATEVKNYDPTLYIKALQTNDIPPTVGYMVCDAACDLDICPNEARKMKIDLALSNSLGFGGHNSCLAFKRVESCC